MMLLKEHRLNDHGLFTLTTNKWMCLYFLIPQEKW